MRRKRLNLIKTLALLMLMCASLSITHKTLAQSRTDESRQSQSAVPGFVLLLDYPGAGPLYIDGIMVTHGIMVTDEIVTTDGIIATDYSETTKGAAPGDRQSPPSAK